MFAPLNKQTPTKMNTQSTARVYVGTYEKYNNGSIAGAWIDLEDHDERKMGMCSADCNPLR